MLWAKRKAATENSRGINVASYNHPLVMPPQRLASAFERLSSVYEPVVSEHKRKVQLRNHEILVVSTISNKGEVWRVSFSGQLCGCR
jgi:hypothetical protein